MRIALAALVVALTSMPTAQANAIAVQCATHQQMLGLLTKKYDENPIAMGTVNEDRFMQLFVSAKGSWTIIVTKTDGEACILAAGQNWERLPELAKLEPSA